MSNDNRIIPKDFTDKYKAVGERCSLFGVPVAELNSDERLAMIGCMSESLDRQFANMKQYFEFVRLLDKTAPRFR